MRVRVTSGLLALVLGINACAERPVAPPAAAEPGDRFLAGRAALRAADPAAAAVHFRAAAEAGHAGAAFSLGVLHALGQGVPGDSGAALGWYRRAAEAAGAEARYNLGIKLEEGAAGRSDEATARRWLERLSRLGEPTNPLGVGSDYPFGAAGLAADPAEAARWYERAAAEGHGMAGYRLGRMYAAGRGVERDLVLAHLWLGRCAERGLGDSSAWVAAVAAEMSPEERTAARALAERWRAEADASDLEPDEPRR
jgi:hypothetical protein